MGAGGRGAPGYDGARAGVDDGHGGAADAAAGAGGAGRAGCAEGAGGADGDDRGQTPERTTDLVDADTGRRNYGDT